MLYNRVIIFESLTYELDAVDLTSKSYPIISLMATSIHIKFDDLFRLLIQILATTNITQLP